MRRLIIDGVPVALAIAVAGLPSAACAQEQVGTSQQAQTVSTRVAIPGVQNGACGPAPSAADLDVAVVQAGTMFPDPAQRLSLRQNIETMTRQTCPRSRIASYMIHLMASNRWRFAH